MDARKVFANCQRYSDVTQADNIEKDDEILIWNIDKTSPRTWTKGVVERVDPKGIIHYQSGSGRTATCAKSNCLLKKKYSNKEERERFMKAKPQTVLTPETKVLQKPVEKTKDTVVIYKRDSAFVSLNTALRIELQKAIFQFRLSTACKQELEIY